MLQKDHDEDDGHTDNNDGYITDNNNCWKKTMSMQVAIGSVRITTLQNNSNDKNITIGMNRTSDIKNYSIRNKHRR